MFQGQLVILSIFWPCKMKIDIKPFDLPCIFEFHLLMQLWYFCIVFRNLSHNSLQGPLPAEFGNLRSIQIMWVLLLFLKVKIHSQIKLSVVVLRIHNYLFLPLVICHSTICWVAFLRKLVSCRILCLCTSSNNTFPIWCLLHYTYSA